MDYSFFDGLIDCVFVINSDKGVIYCNESAAKLCESSVKRLAKGKPIHSIIEFSDKELFTMPNGEKGRDLPAPYSEMKFNLKTGKEGKVQIAIQPFTEASGEKRWAIMIRDVTLEEVLHAKYHKQLEEKEVYIQQLQTAQKQLENYSKNLEQMVEERTQEVNRANIMLNAIMESLGQGFLVFDREGECSKIYTRACEDILETVPANKKIWDVLRVKPRDLETFKMWLTAVFTEQLPFESLKNLGPELFKHSQERHIKLDYFPLRGDKSQITNLVVVATDKTIEFQTNKALEKEKRFAKMVVKLITGKKHFSQFLRSAKTVPDDVRKSLMRNSIIDHEYIFRTLHTLEGESATYSIDEIWQASRMAQEIIEPVKRGENFDANEIKAKLLERLDNLDKAYRQFVENNLDLLQTIGITENENEKIEVNKKDIYAVLSIISKKGVSDSICNEISDQLLREPIVNMLSPYKDVVATVAAKLNKKMAPLEFRGADIRLYTEKYQEFFSSLVHAFRNAIDHGIEASEDRMMMGKSPEGHLYVLTERLPGEPAYIRISIVDDGNGISVEKMKKKLSEQNNISNLDQLSDYDIIQHVFDIGVSTKEEVGEYSGRGVGLNAVKVEAEKLGGRAWVESTPGKGTAIKIELPDIPRLAEKKQAS